MLVTTIFAATPANDLFTSITPIQSSMSMKYVKSACMHKLECILNIYKKFQAGILKISGFMTLFSMHIPNTLKRIQIMAI